jgi:hypothetical protein
MTATRPSLDRRRAIAVLAALPVAAATLLGRPAIAAAPRRSLTPGLLGRAEAAPLQAFPDGATVMVAGPEGGALDAWSRVIMPVLAQALSSETPLRKAIAGGPDGVTGANQFEARGAPDGQTALVVPGAAATAWLVGDSRVQFDASHWVPVLSGATPGVLVARVGPSAFGPGGRPRIAASSPAGAELPALLGIEIMGAQPVPVFGLAEPDDARDALKAGAVDAVFVCGHRVPEFVTALISAGGQPVFSLGARDAAGALIRDPLFPDLPTVADMRRGIAGTPPSGPLYEAWLATAAASQLDFGLVLPQLTPAAMVALWRRACTQAALAPDMQAMAAAQAVRPVANPGPMAAIAADATALLQLRRWLASRYNWHPT